MFDQLMSAIKSRSPDEWKAELRSRIDTLRRYVQEHGERAALIGFLLGIFIVIFYKLVLFLACVALVGYQLLLIISASGR